MASKVGAAVWAGRVLSFLVAVMFIISATMKFVVPPESNKGLEHMGMPEGLGVSLGLLELLCVAVYLVPSTCILGAILLTGYLGGAIFAHVRVDDPFIIQTILGIVVWLAVYLREPRLRSLIPIRISPKKTDPN